MCNVCVRDVCVRDVCVCHVCVRSLSVRDVCVRNVCMRDASMCFSSFLCVCLFLFFGCLLLLVCFSKFVGFRFSVFVCFVYLFLGCKK